MNDISSRAAIIVDSSQSTGALIPISWWIEYLDRHYELDVFLLHPSSVRLQSFLKKYPHVNVRPIYYQSRQSKKVIRYVLNIINRRLFTQGIDFISVPDFDKYKVICSNPISGAEAGNQIFLKRATSAHKIAVISDSLISTYEYKSVEQSHWQNRMIDKCKLQIIKLLNYERALLRNWDTIVVQSENDAIALAKSMTNKYRKRIQVLPNGCTRTPANQVLKHKVIVNRCEDIVIWSDNWRSAKVYANDFIVGLSKTNEQHHVKVLGSLKIDDLQSSQNVKIEALTWIPNLHAYLSGVRFMLVPAFKNFGLINRVIDAMNAGCITVADPSAFNGILGFEHGKHGYQLKDGGAAAQVVVELKNDLVALDTISQNASALIETRHSWQQHEEFFRELSGEHQEF